MDLSFISTAHASATTGIESGFNFMSLLPFAALIGIMYFFIIRPQNKRAKEHQEMVTALKRGDQIVTAGGIIGTVSRVTDNNEILVEMASGVEVRVVRTSVTQVLQKTGTVVQLDTKRNDPTVSTAKTSTSKTTTATKTKYTGKTNTKPKKPVRSVMKKSASSKKSK